MAPREEIDMTQFIDPEKWPEYLMEELRAMRSTTDRLEKAVASLKAIEENLDRKVHECVIAALKDYNDAHLREQHVVSRYFKRHKHKYITALVIAILLIGGIFGITFRHAVKFYNVAVKIIKFQELPEHPQPGSGDSP